MNNMLLIGKYNTYSTADYYTDGKYIYLTIADLPVDIFIKTIKE